MTRAIAIDSNALTYLIEANQESYDPTTEVHLGEQRLEPTEFLGISCDLRRVDAGQISGSGTSPVRQELVDNRERPMKL